MLQLANFSDFQAFDYYDWYKSGTISVKVNPDIDTILLQGRGYLNLHKIAEVFSSVYLDIISDV